MKTTSKFFFFAFLIGEVYSYVLGMVNLTFICHNKNTPHPYGHYISVNCFCDGKYDCGDGEDEHLGCTYSPKGNNICEKRQFTCDGNKCFHIAVRCNTIKDCQDGTDEQNCGNEIDVKNCTSEEKFLCKDGLRCLGLEYTCDHKCHCFDCSDENENCSKHDDNLSQKCPNTYLSTPDGPKCFCQSDKINSSNFCKSFGRCEDSYCDQHCIQFKTKQQCLCYEGYTAIKGSFGSVCRTTADFAVLYANKNEIKYVNNTSLKSSTIVEGIDNCTLLTAANNYVYYTTLSQDDNTSIFKKALNSGKPEKLLETGFKITSIAVDYITNNVYFTGNGSLSVCMSNAQICTQLKCCNVDLVTLAPQSGWMYYMQKVNNPEEISPARYCRNAFFAEFKKPLMLLTKSNMDGSNETIHKRHCFDSDVLMEMDESKNVINLFQNTESSFHVTLLRISVNSAFEPAENMDLVPMHTNTIRHFSFHNDEMFFTLDGANGIFYCANFTFLYYLKNVAFPKMFYLNDNSTSTVTDVYVYNAAVQRSDENPCEKSSCSGLCLLKPEMDPSTHLSHTCFCDDFTPTNDNHWCSNDSTRSNAVVWVFACFSLVIISCAIACLRFTRHNWSRHLPVVVWHSKNESEPSVIK